jgi:hypothetical protein
MSKDFTSQWLMEREARAASKRAPLPNAKSGVPVGYSPERRLREQILAYCASQWPRWKVKTARTDMPSTLGVGVHDLTLFASRSRTFCIELKSSRGKLGPEQRDWKYELFLVGHEVEVFTTFEQFLALIEKPTPMESMLADACKILEATEAIRNASPELRDWYGKFRSERRKLSNESTPPEPFENR